MQGKSAPGIPAGDPGEFPLYQRPDRRGLRSPDTPLGDNPDSVLSGDHLFQHGNVHVSAGEITGALGGAGEAPGNKQPLQSPRAPGQGRQSDRIACTGGVRCLVPGLVEEHDEGGAFPV